MDHGLWDARVLVGFDRKSGRQLWTRTARHRFNLHSVVIGDGLVFACDSLSAVVVDKLKRRGQAKDAYESEVLAVDAKSGEVRWRKNYTYKYRTMTERGPLAIRPYDDWAAYNARHGMLLTGKSGALHALDAKTGEEKWHSERAGIQPLILGDYDFINQSGYKYEVETGKLLSDKQLFQRGACNYTVGSDSLLFLRYKSASYVDLSAGQKHSLRNLRSGCSNSLVAAGGLLNVPCFSTGCVCNYPLQTSFSMYHMPESGEWAGDAAGGFERPIDLTASVGAESVRSRCLHDLEIIHRQGRTDPPVGQHECADEGCSGTKDGVRILALLPEPGNGGGEIGGRFREGDGAVQGVVVAATGLRIAARPCPRPASDRSILP